MTRFTAPVMVLLVSFAAVSPAAPIPKAPEKPVLYYPTKVGAKWVYRHTNPNIINICEAVETLTAVQQMGNSWVVSVGYEYEGKIVPARKVVATEQGLVEVETWGKTLDPVESLLKLPLKAGNAWKSMNGRTVETHTVRTEEEIKVPAGKYRAIRVDIESDTDGKVRLDSYWYARDVGLIERYSESSGQVLHSFTPGKD